VCPACRESGQKQKSKEGKEDKWEQGKLLLHCVLIKIMGAGGLFIKV